MPEITPRLFLAAHAPPEVPDWFRVEPLPRPEEPAIPDILAPFRSAIGVWMRMTDHPLGHYLPDTAGMAVYDAVTVFEKEWMAWLRDSRRTDRLDQERLYAKWRWYYADLVLSYGG